MAKADSNYEKNRSKILFDLPFKKDTAKSHDSAQYDTERSSEKFEYLGENETKNETLSTHWSVAQAGSNEEKNWGGGGGRKSRWTVPLKGCYVHTVQ